MANAPSMLEPAADEDICFQQCSVDFLIRLKDEVLRKKAYQCDSKFRGRALIMNNKEFAGLDDLSDRYGSEVDAEKLDKLFKLLQFDTVVHHDKTKENMLAILTEESREDHHKRYDMFVLFLMSHGNRGKIYGIDGAWIKTTKIMNLFNGRNCPNLVGKPKLFFIQACQGDIKTEGVTQPMIACDSASPVQESLMERMLRELKQEDDFYLSNPLAHAPQIQCDAVHGNVHELVDMACFYAAIPGYAAFRHEDTGSHFVKCFIKVLTMEAHQKDLATMATPIMDKLHEMKVEIEGKNYKAASEFCQRLRRVVYLLPQ